MKKWIGIFSVAVMLVGMTVFNAAAIPITGSIGFTGDFTTNASPENNLTTATAFTSFNAEVNGTSSGSYFGVPDALSVAFTTFAFKPALNPSPLIPLWSFTHNSIAYSFDATGLTIDAQTSSRIDLSGPGMAHITGFDPTPGTWIITANQLGTSATFSSATAVPEPASLLLVGFGLVGLAGIRRKFKR